MNRRGFVKNVFLGGSAVLLPDFEFLKSYGEYPSIEPVKNGLTARVACVKDPLCAAADFSINGERAAALFRKALLAFAGKDTIPEAVQGLFPQFRNDLRVAIKINTASSTLPSHPCVAYAVADCLVEAGLSPDNIIVWERSEKTMKEGGYVIKNEPGSVRTIATDSKGYGHDESRIEKVNGVSLCFSSIVTNHCDYLISLAALKQHIFAGVTLSQKNYYGAIPLYDRITEIGPWDLVRMHLNDCDPSISELNAVMNRIRPTVLYVVDALVGLYSHGPLGKPQFAQNEILLSRDPVAVDTLALYRIEKQRKAQGLKPLLHKSRYIRTSANLGLGTNDPENMEIIEQTV